MFGFNVCLIGYLCLVWVWGCFYLDCRLFVLVVLFGLVWMFWVLVCWVCVGFVGWLFGLCW